MSELSLVMSRKAVRVRSSALLPSILHNSVPVKGFGGAHPFTQRPFQNALFAGFLQRLTNHVFLRRPRDDTHGGSVRKTLQRNARGSSVTCARQFLPRLPPLVHLLVSDRSYSSYDYQEHTVWQSPRRSIISQTV